MKKLLCKLGFHDYQLNIFVRQTPESNTIYRCIRCGKPQPLTPKNSQNVK